MESSFSMQWPKGAATAGDGVIKLFRTDTYDPFDFYHPKEDEKSLYVKFVSLDENDEKAIRDFVSQFGLLGLENRKIDRQREAMHEEDIKMLTRRTQENFLAGLRVGFTLHSPELSQEHKSAEKVLAAYQDELNQALLPENEWEEQWKKRKASIGVSAAKHALEQVKGIIDGQIAQTEVIQEFQQEVRLMRGVVDLSRAYFLQDSNGSVDSLNLVWEYLTGGRAENIDASSNHSFISLSVLIEGGIVSMLNRQLAHGVWPLVRAENGKFHQRWLTENLLTAMYWMLALDISGGLPPRQCANETCPEYFHPRRASQAFCSQKCQEAQKSRRYRIEHASKNLKGEED